MTTRPPPPSECAQCGASIPPNAQACPECGADERTGWREVSTYDGLDLPDEAYAEETGSPPPRRSGMKWFWLAAGLLLVIWLVLRGLALR